MSRPVVGSARVEGGEHEDRHADSGRPERDPQHVSSYGNHAHGRPARTWSRLVGTQHLGEPAEDEDRRPDDVARRQAGWREAVEHRGATCTQHMRRDWSHPACDCLQHSRRCLPQLHEVSLIWTSHGGRRQLLCPLAARATRSASNPKAEGASTDRRFCALISCARARHYVRLICFGARSAGCRHPLILGPACRWDIERFGALMRAGPAFVEATLRRLWCTCL
jgi:hypothetical protein